MSVVGYEISQQTAQIKRIADSLDVHAHDVFIRLPGLGAYFPGSVRDYLGWVRDHSGSGVSLQPVGTCPTGFDGNSFVHLGGGLHYLRVGAFGGITGAEAWIDTSLNGLTVGGWFMLDQSPTTEVGLVSKSGVTTNFGWGLGALTSDKPFFFVSNNGASTFLASAASGQIGVWQFIVGRFVPSTSVDIFMDGVKVSNTTAIPATIKASTQDFEVGRYANDNNRVAHAKFRDLFLVASALTDEQIEEIRQDTLP